MADCLFCGVDLTGRASREHLIPASLGGWLTTDLVCKECNDYFGHTVDAFADSHLLSAVRREVGLESHRRQEGKFFDPHVGGTRRGRVKDDGTIGIVEPAFWYPDGSGVFIEAETRDKALGIAKTIRERKAAEGRSMSFAEVPPAAPASVRMRMHRAEEPRDMSELFHRETAKIAVEYIALVAAPDVARLPALDPIRQFSRDGTGPDMVISTNNVPDKFWLPQTRRLFLRRLPDGTPDHVEQDQTADKLVPADGSPPDPNVVPHWTSFRHQLSLYRGQRDWFQLVLFEWLVASVPLPSGLPIPWGSADALDCLTGETSARRP